jgi:hypothetical protein
MKAAIWIGGLVAILFGIGYLVTAEGAVAVVFGWVSFLRRVLPQMRVDAESAVTGTIALALFTTGVHWLGVSARRARASAEGPRRPWRFRWTAAIVLMVVVSFAAGIAIVGVVHQVGWLAASEQPLTGEALGPTHMRGSQTNLKMIAPGLQTYEMSQDAFLAAATLDSDGHPLHGWESQMLYYLGYSMPGIDRTKPWDDPINRKFFKSVIPEFINASFRTPPMQDENSYGLNHYSANSQIIVEGQGLRLDEITDGASETILLGEVSAGFSPWGRPRNVREPAAGIHRDSETFGGPAIRGGTYFAMAGGSIQFISDDVDAEVLQALSTPAGGD